MIILLSVIAFKFFPLSSWTRYIYIFVIKLSEKKKKRKKYVYKYSHEYKDR